MHARTCRQSSARRPVVVAELRIVVTVGTTPTPNAAAYMVMAYIAMAYMVMAYMVMAYILMANVVTAAFRIAIAVGTTANSQHRRLPDPRA